MTVEYPLEVVQQYVRETVELKAEVERLKDYIAICESDLDGYAKIVASLKLEIERLLATVQASDAQVERLTAEIERLHAAG